MKIIFLGFTIIGIALPILIFSGCDPVKTTTSTTTTTKNTTEKIAVEIPNTKEECLANGGTWKAMGIYPNEICNLPTKDGGKECSSSNDCEGSCLAVNLTDDQRRSLMNGDDLGIKVKGECTGWVRNFGCIGFVENGEVDRFICLD